MVKVVDGMKASVNNPSPQGPVDAVAELTGGSKYTRMQERLRLAEEIVGELFEVRVDRRRKDGVQLIPIPGAVGGIQDLVRQFLRE